MSKRTVSAGGVVLDDRGRVLLVNQRGNSWSLPKGHVDDGEDLLMAARREILEESGISELRLIRELGHYERPRIGKHGGDDPSEIKTLHFYLFRTNQTVLAPQDKDNPEARWVEPDAVAGLLTHPRDRAFFEGIVEDVKRESRG